MSNSNISINTEGMPSAIVGIVSDETIGFQVGRSVPGTNGTRPRSGEVQFSILRLTTLLADGKNFRSVIFSKRRIP